jgi:2-polyprenyl-3-methyl-5-hydroxy-6-metoxy-1,4-benzoquinol methylase
VISDDETVAALLASNVGFSDPAIWIPYARAHGFENIAATKLLECPACGARPERQIGQYVYYSTLIRLIDCQDCGLIWADVRLDEGVIQRHFEHAYKDDSYFSSKRAPIFKQLTRIASHVTPQCGAVLDVGGATGHLLGEIAIKRPDLRLTLNDISEKACETAAAKLGVSTHCGDIETIASDGARFDTVICSDVVYYQPNMRNLWAALASTVRVGGTLILRVPNKVWLITCAERFRGLLPASMRRMQANVAFFNPEHLYVLRRAYIERQLRANGFDHIVARPSPMLRGPGIQARIENIAYYCAEIVCRLTLGRVVITPGLLLIAVKKSS